MNFYPAKLQSILDDLAMFPDRVEKIQVLISIADRFANPTEGEHPKPYPDDHKVPACESEAFVWVSLDDEGKLKLEVAVLNPQGMSAMAMAMILKDSLDGESPETAAHVSEDVIYDIFGKELSMGKSMGLMGMVRLVKHFARDLAGTK